MNILRKILFVLLILGGFIFYQYLPKEDSTTAPIDIINPQNQPEAETVISDGKQTTFVFVGDMMFDRYVNHAFKDKGFDQIFKNLDKDLFKKDIFFANLEGPVSSEPIVDDYPERSLIFNMPPEIIPTLKNLGINGVSLANNHTLNAGEEGFVTTKNLLEKADIKYAGSQNGFNEESITRYETDIPVSVITVDLLAFKNQSKIIEAIKEEKTNGWFVIVFPHWGEEYSLEHNMTQENYAKSFIDAGADLIIGSHPHVVQDVEIYRDRPIIYSLGNFVFDQTFSVDTQQGLIVQGKITENNIEIILVPVESKKIMLEVANDKIRDQILNRIYDGKSQLSVILN